jgi:hypothetical protein
MVEQRYRKPQVEGSIPFTSSKNDKPQGEITLWFFIPYALEKSFYAGSLVSYAW